MSETKLENIEDELDILKTAINKTLLDIREKLNDIENPFNLLDNKLEDILMQKIGDIKDKISVISPKVIEDIKNRLDNLEKELEKSTKIKYIDEDKIGELIDEKFREKEEEIMAIVEEDREITKNIYENLKDIKEILNKISDNRILGKKKSIDESELDKDKTSGADTRSSGFLGDKQVSLDYPENINKRRFDTLLNKHKKIDIFVLNELAKWTENMLKKLGKNKFKKVIEIYSLSGLLPDDIKEVIYKLVPLFSHVPTKTPASTHLDDYMADFALLEKIISMNTVDDEIQVMQNLK